AANTLNFNTAISSHCVDDPGFRINPTDAVIRKVREKEVAKSIQCRIAWVGQVSINGRPSISTKNWRKAGWAFSSDSGYNAPFCIHPPDTIVISIRNVKIS